MPSTPHQRPLAARKGRDGLCPGFVTSGQTEGCVCQGMAHCFHLEEEGTQPEFPASLWPANLQLLLCDSAHSKMPEIHEPVRTPGGCGMGKGRQMIELQLAEPIPSTRPPVHPSPASSLLPPSSCPARS